VETEYIKLTELAEMLHNKLEVYVRRLATTFRTRPEEIVALIQFKQPGTGYTL